jgi:hypothetical protein
MVANNNHRNRYADLAVSALSAPVVLENDYCREVFNHWLECQSGEKKTPLDLLKVSRCVPFIAIMDVVDPLPKFKFRLAGQGIVGISNVDMTGKPVDESTPISFGVCHDVFKARGPIQALGKLTFQHPGKTYIFNETVGLPVEDDAGNLNSIWVAHGLV